MLLMAVTTRWTIEVSLVLDSKFVLASLQVAVTAGEGGEDLAKTAKDIARSAAEQAQPKAAELTDKIEKQAHAISRDAEPWSHDIANEYQKAARVGACNTPNTLVTHVSYGKLPH